MRHRPYATVVMLSLALTACSGSGGASDTASSAPTTSMTYYSGSASLTGSASPSGVPSPSKTRATTGTTTATPAGSATSSVVMPDMPAAAKAHTPEGAAAFARYYIELVNYAWQKPDPAPLRAHALPSCTACTRFADRAQAFRHDGAHIDRPGYSIEAADPGMTLENGEQASILVCTQTAYQKINANGSKNPALASSTVRIQAFAAWTSNGWKIAELEKVR